MSSSSYHTYPLLCFIILNLIFSTQAQTKNCVPKFENKAPWQGADAAYSIPLPDGRDVWIFGDTFYGDNRTVINNMPKMVHNSLGISTCEDGEWNLTYYIKDYDESAPKGFFNPNTTDYFYWALDGIYHKETLWITLLRIEFIPNNSLGFQTCGTDLAKVTNIDLDPQDWVIEIQELVPNGTQAYPGATAFIEEQYMHIYALYENGTRPMILTRVALDSLDSAKDNLEYLHQNETWIKGSYEPAQAKVILDQGSSEMSVRYHSLLKLWVMVQPSPVAFDKTAWFRTATNFTGPWTPGLKIYTYPEMVVTNPHYDNDTFCYAAKEHPEFEENRKMLFTYVCNSMNSTKLEKEMNLYVPQVVQLSFDDLLEQQHDDTPFYESLYFLIGVGVLVVGIVGIVLVKVCNKKRGDDDMHDEEGNLKAGQVSMIERTENA